MLANGNSLFNEVIEIFGNHRCQSFSFQNAEDLVASDKAHLCHAMRVPQYDTCKTVQC